MNIKFILFYLVASVLLLACSQSGTLYKSKAKVASVAEDDTCANCSSPSNTAITSNQIPSLNSPLLSGMYLSVKSFYSLQRNNYADVFYSDKKDTLSLNGDNYIADVNSVPLFQNLAEVQDLLKALPGNRVAIPVYQCQNAASIFHYASPNQCSSAAGTVNLGLLGYVLQLDANQTCSDSTQEVFFGVNNANGQTNYMTNDYSAFSKTGVLWSPVLKVGCAPVMDSPTSQTFKFNPAH